MTERDPALSDTEAAAWAAIVEHEWPIVFPPGKGACDSAGAEVTAYLPHRPSILVLFLEVVCIGGAGAVFLTRVASGFGPALDASTLKQQLTWVIPTVGVMVVLASIITVQACAFAAYRLRLGAVHAVCNGDPDLGLTVRPPNPVTMIVWMGILVMSTVAAAWWVGAGMDAQPARIGNLQIRDHIDVVLTAWLATALVGWLGTTVWAARECRHRIRARSLCQPCLRG